MRTQHGSQIYPDPSTPSQWYRASTSVPDNNKKSKEIRVVLSTVVKETGAHVRDCGKKGRSDEMSCLCMCDGVLFDVLC